MNRRADEEEPFSASLRLALCRLASFSPERASSSPSARPRRSTSASISARARSALHALRRHFLVPLRTPLVGTRASTGCGYAGPPSRAPARASGRYAGGLAPLAGRSVRSWTHRVGCPRPSPSSPCRRGCGGRSELECPLLGSSPGGAGRRGSSPSGPGWLPCCS